MNKEFYIKVGKKIQEIRKEKKMSQKKLAQKLGRETATFVNLIETGKRRVSLYSITKIAEALEVPMSSFLGIDYETMSAEDMLELALISDKKLSSEKRKTAMEFVQFLREGK